MAQPRMEQASETKEKKMVTVPTGFDPLKARADFPVFNQKIYGRPLVYLDNAATSQSPRQVILATTCFLEDEKSNVHRGIHYLSERATRNFEAARVRVQEFINAEHSKEIIFVRGATEAINLVAQTYGRKNIGKGDEILISWMEHHSNIVPWQMLCEEVGAKLKVAPMDDRGDLVFEEYERMLTAKTKLVAMAHVSNALGTVNPVKRIVEKAHEKGILVLIDGAQAVPHQKVDVQDIGCDFYAFSGHKMYGPTGIGVIYGKKHLLEAMPPYQGGGSMIQSVTFEETTYAPLPQKFEAGTQHIAGGIGLGAAVDYLNKIGFENIEAYEKELTDYALKSLSAIPQVRIIGTPKKRAGVISFVIQGAHPHDIGTILDTESIAIRAGHHCAQPVMKRFGVAATARASVSFYNTKEDIDALVRGVKRVVEVFG